MFKIVVLVEFEIDEELEAEKLTLLEIKNRLMGELVKVKSGEYENLLIGEIIGYD